MFIYFLLSLAVAVDQIKIRIGMAKKLKLEKFIPITQKVQKSLPCFVVKAKSVKRNPAKNQLLFYLILDS